MKTKILSGLICCLGIFSANAQTITAPVGTPLTITNAVDVTGGGLNILTDNEYKIGGKIVLSIKGTQNFIGGDGAGVVNTGASNIFLGKDAGNLNTSGFANSFIGSFSGASNVSGNNNMFLGASAGLINSTGNSNTFIGVNAGRNSNGTGNSFIGVSSGILTTSGANNTALGTLAGQINTTGSQNTFVGFGTGSNNATGTFNTFIGHVASASVDGITNATAIGANSVATTSNTVVLGNAATTVTGQGLPTTVSGPGVSGLKFAGLKSGNTPTTGGSGKALSVDADGNVILVGITGPGVGTTSVGGPVAESTWKEADGYLYNNSTNGVVIKGTGLDGNSLIVKGGVLSKEVNVKVEGSESWPDYVFKPNYKRMTLGEVEKFISINGHLPNIPNAIEMAATGNNLGKTDVKLLEKVEELTLYLLEMKKANDAQAAELKVLKQQVSKLRKK